MRSKLTSALVNAAGLSLWMAMGSVSAGTASSVFAVQVTLSSASSCTSASSTGAASSSVQVQCNSNIFVRIDPLNGFGDGRFVTGFSPVRDTLLPDNCRNERGGLAGQPAGQACGTGSDDASAVQGDLDDNGGWGMEGRLYSINADAASRPVRARLRLRNSEGTVTALRVDRTASQHDTVELLVSF